MDFITGKVALVTGGASGIGLAIVQKLLENGIRGVGVVDIADINLKTLREYLHEKNSNKIIFIKADVTNKQELEDAFENVVEKFCNIDIVVNNAGIANEIEWEKTIAINLKAIIRGTYLAKDKYFPLYKSGEEGIIINTASVLGLRGCESLPVYVASKHGVVGLGKALGMQKSTTRIITICPGLITTPLLDNVVAVDVQTHNTEFSSNKLVPSPPTYVGESVIKIIQEGKHGSVWIMEDNKPPYEHKISNSE